MSSPLIRVKFLNKSIGQPDSSWWRLFPEGQPFLNRCHFIFDASCRDYDWLVVYDELPRSHQETLACRPENTLLVTVEPSSIKCYGRNFLSQFGHVLTGQEHWALSHPGKIWSQPALLWFYGSNTHSGKSFDSFVSAPPLEKNALLSTVCSTKQQGHTLHRQRYRFTEQLKHHLPYIDHFGLGVRPIADKSEALDRYFYHIAIENHRAPHWWTEKISDAFLGHTLPFYYGAPNLSDYFPPESFIPIDIFDVEASAHLISSSISNDEYQRRLPAIREARNLVLHRYSLFATLAAHIEARHLSGRSSFTSTVLRSRHDFRKTLHGKITTLAEKIQWKINCARHIQREQPKGNKPHRFAYTPTA